MSSSWTKLHCRSCQHIAASFIAFHQFDPRLLSKWKNQGYWVEEMHVDGFRFDLASALTRGGDGKVHSNFKWTFDDIWTSTWSLTRLNPIPCWMRLNALDWLRTDGRQPQNQHGGIAMDRRSPWTHSSCGRWRMNQSWRCLLASETSWFTQILSAAWRGRFNGWQIMTSPRVPVRLSQGEQSSLQKHGIALGQMVPELH